MDFKDLTLKRESCRAYTGEKITKEQLEIILEAGRMSPSACNSQPWYFYAVIGEKIDAVTKGVQFFKTNPFASKAGAYVVVIGAKPNYPERVGQSICGREFMENDIGMTVVSMAYQAADIGLGTCIIGAFNEKVVKEAIGMDKKDKRSIKLILAIGVPEKAEVRKKTRKSLDEIVTFVD